MSRGRIDSAFIWVIGLVLFQGCSGRGIEKPPSPTSATSTTIANDREVALDGALIFAGIDPLTGLGSATPRELFEAALEHERQKDEDGSKKIYRRLLEVFPQSHYRFVTRFNLGLLLEADKNYQEASLLYSATVKEDEPEPRMDRITWVDSHYRLAVNHGALKKYWDAVAVFDRILSFDFLDDGERLEAMAGRAIMIDDSGDTELAEVALGGVLHFYRKAERRGRIDRRGIAAEAAYRLGEIAKSNYDGIILEFPADLLRSRLEEKCKFLLTAQSRYLRAIRYGDAHTVTIAGFKIGALYETLFDRMLGLKVPPELSQEQVAIYQGEVKTRIQVLLKKALRVYEQALDVGRRLHVENEWVAKLESSVERVKDIYFDEEEIAFRR